MHGVFDGDWDLEGDLPFFPFPLPFDPAELLLGFEPGLGDLGLSLDRPRSLDGRRPRELPRGAGTAVALSSEGLTS